MNKNIIIPIVDKKRPLRAKLFRYVFAGFILLLLSSVSFIGTQTTIILIVLTVVSGIANAITKGYSSNGNLTFKNNQVIINSTEKEILMLKDLRQIKIKYFGYEGENYILNLESIFPKDGTGNIIEFHFNSNKKLVFELLFKKKMLVPLNKILHQWKKDFNLKVIMIGEWGMKTKNI